MTKLDYYPSKLEFKKLAKRGNLIPVYCQLLADFDTPVSSFSKIDRGDYSFLFESVEAQEKVGRYSFLGSSPQMVIRSKGKDFEIERGRRIKRYQVKGNPLDEIKKILTQYKFVKVKGIPIFSGGLVGYMGYDMVRFIEDIPDKTTDTLKLPDCLFMLFGTVLIFDNVYKTLKVVSNAHIKDGDAESAYNKALKKIDQKVKLLKKSSPPERDKAKKKPLARSRAHESNFTKGEFKKIVSKAKKYIRSGEIIQVVLSQEFKSKIQAKPFDVYRALRYINPSPYMFYLKFKDLKLIGSSQEIMVRLNGKEVQIRPIAGTRRRGRDEKEDQRLIKDLLNDPKEKAEHIMLVDLGRNDIGRICQAGTVKVRELMTVEKYSHVIHLVSDCAGKIKKGKDMFDCIKSTFPAGTVSGAPKVRAMEIIEELEKNKRGPYAGAVMYFAFSGNLDSCITIRTIIVKKDTAYIQAGAGIVADSHPEREYQETINKAKAMLKAVDYA
jgi:anthranilate synthase component I